MTNDTVDKATRKALTKRGHEVSTKKGAIANPVMIYLDPNSNEAFAAGDPQAKRHAAAADGGQ